MPLSHRRRSDKARVGLPEIKVGLFPGGGGTQRVARLMPTPDALQMLLKGDQIRPAAAKKMGLVHEVAPADQIVALAKAWVKANPNAKAPWDDPKFKLPSGKVFSPQGMMIWPPANAIYRRETYDNYPAAKAILTSVFEGLQLPMDLALAVESKHFANILLSKEAAAMIRSLFLSMGELNKGARRPANVPPTNLRKIGVLGAGLMGAGIAYVSASAGLEVVLIDRDQESADKGKAYSDKIVSSQIAKGRAKTADKEALLARIRATADYSELKGCDLIIEAVFEDRAVKAEATRKAQAVVGPDVVFASNTSTLPISSLAATSLNARAFHRRAFLLAGREDDAHRDHHGRKDRREGAGDGDGLRARDQEDADRGQRLPRLLCQPLRRQLHGRSPRDGDGGRAAADDRECRQDGRHAGRAAGAQRRSRHRPVVEDPSGGQERSRRQRRRSGPGEAHRSDGGRARPARPQERQGLLRLSRRTGRRACGRDLASIVGKRLDPDAISVKDLKDRYLFTVALEAARCLFEGIVTDPREADVGSILGFGYAPYSGGAISFIDGMGLKAFVARAKELAAKYGPRFEPGDKLTAMAERGETFYGIYGEKQKAA